MRALKSVQPRELWQRLQTSSDQWGVRPSTNAALWLRAECTLFADKTHQIGKWHVRIWFLSKEGLCTDLLSCFPTSSWGKITTVPHRPVEASIRLSGISVAQRMYAPGTFHPRIYTLYLITVTADCFAALCRHKRRLRELRKQS